MMGYMIPPVEDVGQQVTDPKLLDEIIAARGNRSAVTALAKRIGAAHGLPNADHFYVPPARGGEGIALPGSGHIAAAENGLMVAFVAAWVADA